MKLVELTRPDFLFKDIHTAYIHPALTPPAPIQPAKKPTQEELKNEQAARRFFVILRGIGLLFALLLLFAFSFSIGGFIITGIFAAFVIAPKPVSVTLTAYLTWLLTHFAGVGVFALTAIPAVVVAVLRQDVWLSLIAVLLVLCLVTAAVTSLAVRLFGNRRPVALDEEEEEASPATVVAQKLPAILLDYYAPLSQFPRATVLRSQFATPEDYDQALAEADEQRTTDRYHTTSGYIISVEDDDGDQEGVVLVRLRVKDNRANLAKQAETINDLLDAYGTRVVDTQDGGGSVLFRVNTVRLPTPMETIESTKTSTDFYLDNPTGRITSYTAGVDPSNTCLSLPLSHTLVLGATGAGKGSMFRAIVAHAAPYIQQGTIRAYVIDPKNGEAKAFKKSRSLFERIETKSEQMADVVDEVYDVLKQRQEADDEWEISPENPVILLFVDELLSLFKDPVFLKRKDDNLGGMTTLQKLEQILAQGRSDRVFAIAATQNATKSEMGNLRDNFTVRILLRVDNIKSAADYFLGVAADSVEVIAPSTEDNGYRTAGIGYIKIEGREGATLMRFGFMDNRAFAELGRTYQPHDYDSSTEAPLDEAQHEDADAEAVRLALENLS